MAIQDEKIIENFQVRNLGASGIASRELQAANLPKLGAALAESQATQDELARRQKFSLANLRGPAVTPKVAQSAAKQPLGYISLGTGSDNKYKLHITGQMDIPEFGSLNQLKVFLSQNPQLAGRLGFAGDPNTQGDIAGKIGVPFVPHAQLRDFLGTGPGARAMAGGDVSAQAIMKKQAEMEKAAQTAQVNEATRLLTRNIASRTAESLAARNIAPQRTSKNIITSLGRGVRV